MATPAEQVGSTFSLAQSYALSAQSKVNSFTSQLQNTIYAAPTLSYTWSTITPPSLAAMPNIPAMPDILFNTPAGQPTALNLAAPTIAIDDFTETAPVLSLPAAPVVSYGNVPTVPDIGTVEMPDAPTITLPGMPVFLPISSVSFAGVDLHEDWLERLETIPELTLVEPTPYSYTQGPEYASILLDGIKTTLADRMDGGTGLDPAVEQAIWDRARSRETQIALAGEAETIRASEVLGFALPTGVLAAQIQDARRNYHDKLSELSRDVAIKQAELEQENIKQTIEHGMALEGKLIDYSYQLEQMTFEHARAVASNATDIHRAQVEQYSALLKGYETYSAGYRTLIDSEMTKIEIYKAELSAEQTKVQVNNAIVDRYKAQIEAGMSQVEIYRAQVGAAETLVQLEQTKISAAGEQIKAYVAQVNAETAKVEAYKANIQAEQTRVDVYKTKADAFSAKVGAQAERARLEISRYSALLQAKNTEWDGYRAKLQTETARLDALGRQSAGLLDGYQAQAASVQAQAGMHTKLWETQIKEYESSQSMALQTARFNSDALNATNQSRLDAAKVGAQVYAQLTASAYGMINASASVGATSSMSVGYSYSGEVNGKAGVTTSI